MVRDFTHLFSLLNQKKIAFIPVPKVIIFQKSVLSVITLTLNSV